MTTKYQKPSSVSMTELHNLSHTSVYEALLILQGRTILNDRYKVDLEMLGSAQNGYPRLVPINATFEDIFDSSRKETRSTIVVSVFGLEKFINVTINQLNLDAVGK